MTLLALTALALATNPLPAGGPAYAGLLPPPRVRRGPVTADDLFRLAAAQAKRERRAARNRARALAFHRADPLLQFEALLP